jgi:hypothetical protein
MSRARLMTVSSPPAPTTPSTGIKELPPHSLAQVRRFYDNYILLVITEFLLLTNIHYKLSV